MPTKKGHHCTHEHLETKPGASRVDAPLPQHLRGLTCVDYRCNYLRACKGISGQQLEFASVPVKSQVRTLASSASSVLQRRRRGPANFLQDLQTDRLVDRSFDRATPQQRSPTMAPRKPEPLLMQIGKHIIINYNFLITIFLVPISLLYDFYEFGEPRQKKSYSHLT